MRIKDLRLFALLVAALCALLAPALLHPSLSLANFGDLYSYHWPLRHLVAARLQEGGLPAWNPYVFSGLPLLANPQACLFYPPSALFQVLPVSWAFTLNALFHLALAAFGMQLLMRRAGSDGAGAALLAAAFAFSPMLLYRIPQGIPTQLAVLAWTPWCWLGLRAGRPWLLGGAWALQFLAGHPQYGLVNAVGLLLYALLDPPRLRTFAAGAAVALPLALVQLFPTAEFLSASNRVGWASGSAGAYSLPPSALASLALPSLAGTPLDGSFAGWPSEFFEFHAAVAGPALVLLALAGLAVRRAPFGAAPWLLLPVGVFFALGGKNPLLPLSGLPLLGLLRVPARFVLLVFWGLLLASAAGWALLRRRRWLPRVLRAGIVLLVLVELVPLSARFLRAEDAWGWMGPRPEFTAKLGGRPWRFASTPEVANPNKAVFYRAMNASGYDAFYLRRYSDYLGRGGEGSSLDASRVLAVRPEALPWRRLSVIWRLDPTGLSGMPGAMPLGRSGGTPAVTWMLSPERWRLHGETPAAGTLVFAMPAYPGWRAFVDGKPAPIGLSEGLFQSVQVPAGPWTADFRFRSTLFPLFACVSAAAAALWLAAARRSLA
ncbi:MAG: hypothetical protein WC969_08710 [Elusimicrobiota bacterium]|jgi:hypothetical protein